MPNAYKIARMMILLERLEWINGVCPICSRQKQDGHRIGCTMGDTLRE